MSNQLEPQSGSSGTDMGMVAYICYGLGIFAGIGTLAGVVIAFMQEGTDGGWRESHYTWLIRTFWLGLAGSIVATLTMFLGVGTLLFIFLFIWYVIRVVKGWQAYSRQEAMPDPDNLLFG